jgi:hypothetical protein
VNQQPPADASAGADTGQDEVGRPPVAFLLGAVGLLTALLGVLATANGGIDRVERNEHWALFAGTVAVLVAVAVGALYATLTSTRPKRRRSGRLRRFSTSGIGGIWLAPLRWLARLLDRRGLVLLLLIGVAALAAGLITVSYAAVAHVAGRPAITATLRWDKTLGLLLDGDVTVSDIASSTHLEMRIDALIPSKTDGRLVATAIYAASLGPNSSGDVGHAYQVAIPERTYQVLVQAWTGDYGYCFNTEIPRKTAQARIANDLGCLRVRIPPALTASHR